MEGNFIPGLLISLGVILAILILVGIFSLISAFKTKFNSNFFLTDTVFWILIGQAMMVGSIFGLNNTTDTFMELLTFSASWGGISWIFYWGLVSLLIGWIINISRSSLGWGMFQNIVQGAVVLVFSVILAIGALLVLDKLKKK